jgi:hypothetical protein
MILDVLNRERPLPDRVGFAGINIDNQPIYSSTFTLKNDYNGQELQLLYDADARTPVDITIRVDLARPTTYKMRLSFTQLTQFGELLDSAHIPLPVTSSFIFIRRHNGDEERAELQRMDLFSEVYLPEAQYEIIFPKPTAPGKSVLLLDASGTMGSALVPIGPGPRRKIDIAIALARAFSQCDPECEVTAFPGLEKRQFDPIDLDATERVEVRGRGQLWAAVEGKVQEMGASPGKKRLIVITDGRGNVKVDDYRKAASAIAKHNVVLDLVVLVNGRVPSLFPIARLSDGHVFQVTSLDSGKKLFGQREFVDFSLRVGSYDDVIPRNTELEIEPDIAALVEDPPECEFDVEVRLPFRQEDPVTWSLPDGDDPRLQMSERELADARERGFRVFPLRERPTVGWRAFLKTEDEDRGKNKNKRFHWWDVVLIFPKSLPGASPPVVKVLTPTRDRGKGTCLTVTKTKVSEVLVEVTQQISKWQRPAAPPKMLRDPLFLQEFWRKKAP